jgi:DNA-binding MarR family transcriptional regulator
MAKRSAPRNSTIALDDLLCFAIHSTGFAFNKIYRKPLRSLGLTYPQYLVMVALWNEDHVTVGHHGDLLALDTGTLTPLLKRLETMGFLTRKRSKADERRVIVALTEKGRALRQKSAEVTRCVMEGVGLSLSQIAQLTRDIRALRHNLEQAARKPVAAA